MRTKQVLVATRWLAVAVLLIVSVALIGMLVRAADEPAEFDTAPLDTIPAHLVEEYEQTVGDDHEHVEDTHTHD